MTEKQPYHLFDVFGVELEYMVVDRDTLQVRPIVDELFKEILGKIDGVENGEIAWSNELVTHVVELKTAGPAASLHSLPEQFAENVRLANMHLAKFNAMIMPTASHPFMDPFEETVIWPHEYNEIYNLYNRIFDCRGHGWANLQSTHLNLPFANDEEFAKLHAAVRILLPILPALCASSPMHDAKLTGYADSRMKAYLSHQSRLPILGGMLVPEQVFNKADYHSRIFDPIKKAITPYDTEHVLDHHFLNSRGAIARFDRGAIEIRVMDIQECPLADLSIVALVVAVLQALIAERWVPLAGLMAWREQELFPIFEDCIKDAEQAALDQTGYLQCFGRTDAMSARALWQYLYARVSDDLPAWAKPALAHILTNGTLSTRIKRELGDAPTLDRVKAVYRRLADCANANQMF